MNLNYQIIGTGSTGNATIIENKILIDCGVPYKKISKYLNNIKIILLTHKHQDHLNLAAIKKILKHQDPPIVFANSEVESFLNENDIDIKTYSELVDIDQEFIIPLSSNCEFKFKTFPLVHDVKNNAWLIKTGNKSYFYATDTKTLENIHVKGASLYLVEANYGDNEISQRINEKISKGQYAYEMQVRDRHMSIENTLDWLMDNMSDESKYVLMHAHQ